MFKLLLIKSLLVCSALSVTSIANANRDPFTYEIGKIFRHSLYEFENGIGGLTKGHTIARHWNKSFSELVARCSENNNGTFSTWTNKGIAYDRIQKTFRRNEANMVNLAATQYTRGTIYRHFNPQYHNYGDLVRCSLHPVLRYADYLRSGTKRTRIVVNGRFGHIALISAFPVY